ncbi:hypothetical protein DYST_02068 [Dyella terrae]|nr:hypothetical protein DYST_02068 [Dyella terrae]
MKGAEGLTYEPQARRALLSEASLHPSLSRSKRASYRYGIRGVDQNAYLTFSM